MFSKIAKKRRLLMVLGFVFLIFPCSPFAAEQTALSSNKAISQSGHGEHSQDLLNLDFQDIPVRNVLQLLATYSGFNIVVSDQVSGSLSLRLQNVDWQKALDIILQMKNLTKRVEGNVILVTTAEEQKTQESSTFKPVLQTRIFQVNHIDIAQAEHLITGEAGVGLLSLHGSVTISARTNSLIVSDLPDRIHTINEFLSIIDVERKQVEIEARIVSIKEGNLDELGVKWSYTSASQINSSDSLDMSSSGVDHLFNVDLPATSTGAATLAFQVAKFGSGALLDLELTALQRESKAEVISSPRLITTDSTPAYIEQGTEIPYSESSSSGATSVSFKKAVLSLTVTPKIMPNHRVLLDIDVTQDHPGEVVQTGTGEAVAVDTQKIGTQVLVNDGATVVLGGIHQNSSIEIAEKVPLLGDLPLLGVLFRRSYEQKTKSELIIFVTPKVMSVQR
ncbi:type IV pilus secretin PilQ [Vibrio marisflavi]|uniref:Type IV pilus biogenesis and competence protein PilQ n=1 Tax=Vibrio marisflavi CECT 7928 TaxID=634439 RepID=A0ABM9A7Q5_9VIBR|nr:type IV pilus secretin PilQ [Vibrio marisflavi]CAH0541673.1 Type IV pilus biogenesis and competence protein PilQ [Vibrio marisflavi CECT 7928]